MAMPALKINIPSRGDFAQKQHQQQRQQKPKSRLVMLYENSKSSVHGTEEKLFNFLANSFEDKTRLANAAPNPSCIFVSA